jgi:molybdate transport system substrate-binding protein
VSIRSVAAAAKIGVLVLLAHGITAQAAEVKLISAATIKPVMKAIGSQFERETGHTLVVKYVAGPLVKQAIDAGEGFDVAISITPVIDTLIEEGKIVARTRADVAYAGLGVGVRVGAPHPDISSVEAFKHALLNAKSVAHNQGASGVYFKGLLERMGIAEAMQPKTKSMPADRIVQAVPSGEADMIVVTISVVGEYGADLVGPLPSELQFYNRFATGIGAQAKQTDAAEAMVRFLTSPTGVAVIKAKGMEPGAPPGEINAARRNAR